MKERKFGLDKISFIVLITKGNSRLTSSPYFQAAPLLTNAPEKNPFNGILGWSECKRTTIL
jgi:hypothetical protein